MVRVVSGILRRVLVALEAEAEAVTIAALVAQQIKIHILEQLM